MAKVGAIVSILAAAVLAACTSYEAPRTSSAQSRDIVTRDMGYTPGTGVVQSATAIPSGAVAGGSAAPTPSDDVRLAIKMDSGRIQYVDTDSRDFPVGTRVRLTEDRVIMREQP